LQGVPVPQVLFWQHTQVSATRLLVAFVWKWGAVMSWMVAAP